MNLKARTQQIKLVPSGASSLYRLMRCTKHPRNQIEQRVQWKLLSRFIIGACKFRVPVRQLRRTIQPISAGTERQCPREPGASETHLPFPLLSLRPLITLSFSRHHNRFKYSHRSINTCSHSSTPTSHIRSEALTSLYDPLSFRTPVDRLSARAVPQPLLEPVNRLEPR